MFFARILGFDEIDMQTTAIASSDVGDACIVVLDPSVDDALRIGGNASVTMDCGARVNSTSTRAIRTNGGGCITASVLYAVGDSLGGCIDPPVEPMDPMPDPLGYLTPPTDFDDFGCTYAALVEVTTDAVLDPGVYCGGIHIYGSGNVSFNSGIYTVGGRGLEIEGSVVVTGDEVMFYLQPTVTGVTVGSVTTSLHLAGTADITLSAPDSGDYQDVLFYQDPATPDDFINTFNGGADLELNGVLYFPNNHVRFAGNGDPGGATSIVARTVFITGNANFGSNPETVMFGPGGAGSISLVQ